MLALCPSFGFRPLDLRLEIVLHTSGRRGARETKNLRKSCVQKGSWKATKTHLVDRTIKLPRVKR